MLSCCLFSETTCQASKFRLSLAPMLPGNILDYILDCCEDVCGGIHQIWAFSIKENCLFDIIFSEVLRMFQVESPLSPKFAKLCKIWHIANFNICEPSLKNRFFNRYTSLLYFSGVVLTVPGHDIIII